jgi:hypothetical protein
VTTEELLRRIDDGITALERIADALEQLLHHLRAGR